MKKLLTHLIILTFIFSNFVNADIVDSNKLVSNFLKKDIKPYMCNYKVGVLQNPNVGKTGDPCMEKGESPVKFYIEKKYKSSDKDNCIDWIKEATSTSEMLRKYPGNEWMVGCDDRW
jgi:hypothetical protein